MKLTLLQIVGAPLVVGVIITIAVHFEIASARAHRDTANVQNQQAILDGVNAHSGIIDGIKADADAILLHEGLTTRPSTQP